MKKILIGLSLMMIYSCDQSTMKTFESEQGWFTIQIPHDWEIDYEDDGTYLFYNPGQDWGSLRISAMKRDSDIDNFDEFVSRQLTRMMEESNRKGYDTEFLKIQGQKYLHTRSC